MLKSALITRLERYLELTPEERDALDWAERREQRIRAGQVLMAEGAANDQLYVVQQGWLHSSTTLASGGRQIVRFHYAGDLIGTSSIAWSFASATLTAVSDCIVSELSKVNLGRIFKAQPRLAGLLYAVASAENVAMSDRLTSIGRTGAVERLSTLLLDMLARLRTTAGGVVDSFELPLTQADIGDAVGLTKVHVNRTIREMERREIIERIGRRVRIKNEKALAQSVGFVDRYAEVATDWLPAAA
jgi:CRP/FNR family transcriptional regulator, anaerobic regulatory protein